jgi:hypothetical protein
MDDLVGDDVVGQRGVDDLVRPAGCRALPTPEVAEQQRTATGRVEEGVRHLARMRVDPEAILDSVAGLRRPRPDDRPAEGPLEGPDRPHRHRVDHLLVRLEVHLGRLEPAGEEDVRGVEVHAGIGDRAPGSFAVFD